LAHDSGDIVRAFFDTVWVRGDAAAGRAFFAPGAEAAGFLTDMALRPEDFAIFVDMVHMHVDDLKVEILNEVAEGDWISVLVRFTGVSTQTGQPMTAAGQTMMEIRDGLILSAYNHFDLIGFFIQIGALPRDIVERALGGDKAA